MEFSDSESVTGCYLRVFHVYIKASKLLSPSFYNLDLSDSYKILGNMIRRCYNVHAIMEEAVFCEYWPAAMCIGERGVVLLRSSHSISNR